MQISSWKGNATKCLKKWIWEGLGLHLGGVWDSLGRLLDALRRLLAGFGVFWACSKWDFCKALVQDRLQEATWIDLGVDFGRVFGGVSERFRPIFKLDSLNRNSRYHMHLLGDAIT